ncbi:hypothetical protein ACS15_5009 [Ralstonia insidiosa]|uniref:Uncharacterized protein n=1 Tax=Ralstonia insidiosa TaxID=190721 RepID=A0AAC9FTS6_9RALS|nr:hypothetical protein ACS15_5009 [Ralstonia insidiosa]
MFAALFELGHALARCRFGIHSCVVRCATVSLASRRSSQE